MSHIYHVDNGKSAAFRRLREHIQNQNGEPIDFESDGEFFCQTEQFESDESTLLHFAVKCKNKLAVAEICNFYTASNNLSMLETKNKDGKTPLMIAATMGLTDIATILVDNGADCMAKDKYKNTALHLAVEEGHLTTVIRLLDLAGEIMRLDPNEVKENLVREVSDGYELDRFEWYFFFWATKREDGECYFPVLKIRDPGILNHCIPDSLNIGDRYGSQSLYKDRLEHLLNFHRDPKHKAHHFIYHVMLGKEDGYNNALKCESESRSYGRDFFEYNVRRIVVNPYGYAEYEWAVRWFIEPRNDITDLDCYDEDSLKENIGDDKEYTRLFCDGNEGGSPEYVTWHLESELSTMSEQEFSAEILTLIKKAKQALARNALKRSSRDNNDDGLKISKIIKRRHPYGPGLPEYEVLWTDKDLLPTKHLKEEIKDTQTTELNKNGGALCEEFDESVDESIRHYLNLRNKYKKSAFITACEFSKLEIATYILSHSAWRKDKYISKELVCSSRNDNISALMYAVKSGKLALVKLLVENGADMQQKTSWGDTALHWSVSYTNDMTEIVAYLLETIRDAEYRRLSDEQMDDQFRMKKAQQAVAAILNEGKKAAEIPNKFDNVLMRAAAYGNLETVKLLVKNGADTYKYGMQTFGKSFKSASDYAFDAGHWHICLYLLELEGDLNALVDCARGVLDTLKEQRKVLGANVLHQYLKGPNNRSMPTMMRLSSLYPALYDVIFELLLSEVHLSDDEVTNFLDAMYHFYARFISQNATDSTLVRQTMALFKFLLKLAARYPNVSGRISNEIDTVLKPLVKKVFASNTLLNLDNVCRLLEDKELRIEEYDVFTVRLGHLLFQRTLEIATSNQEMSELFGYKQIGIITLKLFNGNMRVYEESNEKSRRAVLKSWWKSISFLDLDPTYISETEKESRAPLSETIGQLCEHSRFAILRNLRYSPKFLFALSGISKASFLALIAIACQEHANQCDGILYCTIDKEWTTSEIWLLVYLFSSLLSEFGELEGCTMTPSILNDPVMVMLRKCWRSIFCDVWNALDFITLLLVAAWAIAKVEENIYARACLALSAIPASMCLLRFAVIYEECGKLVLTTISMLNDIIPFVIIFMISILGFVVFNNALYRDGSDDESGFPNIATSFISLFDSNFGIYEWGWYREDSPYYTMGILIQISYLILTLVLLMNLLIAKMSSTYAYKEHVARQDWILSLLEISKTFICVGELHPFYMLPPPLNILTILLSPLHSGYIWLAGDQSKVISILGTIVDFLFHVLILPIVILLDTAYCIYDLNSNFLNILAIFMHVSWHSCKKLIEHRVYLERTEDKKYRVVYTTKPLRLLADSAATRRWGQRYLSFKPIRGMFSFENREHLSKIQKKIYSSYFLEVSLGPFYKRIAVESTQVEVKEVGDGKIRLTVKGFGDHNSNTIHLPILDSTMNTDDRMQSTMFLQFYAYEGNNEVLLLGSDIHKEEWSTYFYYAGALELNDSSRIHCIVKLVENSSVKNTQSHSSPGKEVKEMQRVEKMRERGEEIEERERRDREELESTVGQYRLSYAPVLFTAKERGAIFKDIKDIIEQ